MFTANYSVSQSATGTTGYVTDTSDYTSEPHNTFVSRTLNIYDVYGNNLGPGLWPFTDGDTYPFAVTPWDLSLRIELKLVSSAPVTGSVYTKTGIAVLTVLSYLFGVAIAQNIAANPSIVNQVGYQDAMSRFWTDLKNAVNMGSYSQQQLAQTFLDDIYYLYQNKTTFFG